MKEKFIYGKDFHYSSRDFVTNKEGLVTEVWVTDFSMKNRVNEFQRIYKTYENTLGTYINFHGSRIYILVK